MNDELRELIAPFGLDSEGERWVEHVARTEQRRPARWIAGCEVLEEVARGGQGVVYRALQPVTRRQVALKRPRAGALADRESRRRFGARFGPRPRCPIPRS